MHYPFDVMDAPAPDSADADPLPSTAAPVPSAPERVTAMLEILMCSGFPTQIAIGQTLALAGVRPQSGGSLSLPYVAAVSLMDTVVLIALMLFFVRARGEDPRTLFLGSRPVLQEARVGVPLLFVAFGIAVALMLTVQASAPWLHNVARNPFQDAVKTRVDVALLIVLVVVAGGLREEAQRAFLLGRFERWLGGARVGLVVTSVAFGLGHYYEGRDAVIVTAALGAFWGALYLRRRSIAAPVVSHGGFNLLQVVQFLAVAR